MRNMKTHCLHLHVMCGDGQGSCDLCDPALVVLRAAPECKTCGGTGKIVEEAVTAGANQHSACQMDCEDCDGAGRLRAPAAPGGEMRGWNDDMTRLPAAVTLIFRDPVGGDGCEIVRLGLSTDAMNATGWSHLPGVAPPVLPVGVREAVARLTVCLGQGDPADDVAVAADIRTVLAALSEAGE